MSPPRKVLVDVTNKRFATPVSPTSMKRAAKGVLPANTEASSKRIILMLGPRVDWILEASVSPAGYFEVTMPISCANGFASS